MRIDVHNHVVPERAITTLRSDPVYRVEIEDGQWRGGNHVDFPLHRSFVSPEAKLAELERSAIDAAIVSAAPPLFYYELERGPAEALCHAVNGGMREFVAAAPGRLWWLAHVPLQVPELAASVLEQAAGEGCVGVEIGSAVAGERLDEERFAPFWKAAERLRTPVMIHPDPSHSAQDGLDRFYLGNVIGMPLETTIALKRLISAGVLERHPGLQVVLLHGGGYFPYQADRLRHARGVRPELADAPADPWDAREQLWFDAITHDAAALRFLADRVGVDRVLLGTDLPFDMALPEPIEVVTAALDADGLRAVSEENPARLFGVSAVS